MYLELDGSGPLHGQLTRALKGAMYSGSVHAGSRLPPSRLLARELGVSRNTVLAAYEQLRAEGFLDGRVGSGSFVAPLPQGAYKDAAEPEKAEPQSRYARRGRRFHDHAKVPGLPVPGVRHAFQYGVPLTHPAITTAWARALSQAAQYTSPFYPMTRGLPALREAVCDYLVRRRGIAASPEDVLIVSGTQQAIALTARVLLDPGDRAAIEEPHYFALRTGLLVHGAELYPVPVDGDGLRCEELPQPPAKLVCVTPSHQFPSGAVLSLPRRMALLEYARKHGGWIFEDDYDGEFRYDGKPVPALRALDEAGRVVYVGSFSKVMFPALRMAYLLMPPSLREDFVNAKWMDDFGCPAVEQAAMAGFIASGAFERHLRRSALTLRERRGILLKGLRACGRGRLEIADSHAGMHLVVWLRDASPAQGQALIEYARNRGLGLYPISPFYIHAPARAGLLMGFAGLSPAEIEQALVTFAESLDAVLPV